MDLNLKAILARAANQGLEMLTLTEMIILAEHLEDALDAKHVIADEVIGKAFVTTKS